MSGAWKALYPFKGRRIDVGGCQMHYLDEGQGELVLMVHGNPTWSFYFRELVKALRGTHRCLVPDHVGMGLSDRPYDHEYEHTLESRVRDLGAFMERVAPDGPVTLIVHDWGGMIGMSWAARNPRRVKAIVAMNTACFRLPEDKEFPPALSWLRGPAGALLRLLPPLRGKVLDSCTVRPLAREVRAGYLEPVAGWEAGRALHRFVQDIPLAPGDRAWATVAGTESALERFQDTPMLLPWGMKDWVFDEQFLKKWQRLFPKAKAHRFEDAGHLLLEDAPERVVPLIRDFVAGTRA